MSTQESVARPVTDIQIQDTTPTLADRPGRSRAIGVALMLGTSASNQTGAALGALAFPVLGPIGVVGVRQFVSAVALVPTVRPRVRGLRPIQWGPVVALALVFGLMNLSLYLAIDRIGLAAAVTLEFLGPLAVAILGSRSRIDLAAAALAGVGVLALTQPGPTTDLLGIALGLTAAACWAAYIVLNRTIGRQLPGVEGVALASLISAALWLPIGLVWLRLHPPTPAALALAGACGLLASVAPYVGDLLALRRVSAAMYGTFTAVNPLWAALAGWLVLAQPLAVLEWLGVVLIVVSSVLVTAAGSGRHP